MRTNNVIVATRIDLWNTVIHAHKTHHRGILASFKSGGHGFEVVVNHYSVRALYKVHSGFRTSGEGTGLELPGFDDNQSRKVLFRISLQLSNSHFLRNYGVGS